MKSDLDKYIGKKIESFVFQEERLVFTFQSGETVNIHALGDCCSHSWFEGISGEEALNPGSILYELSFIDRNELPDLVGLHWDIDGDCIQFYGIKIKTSNGYCDIDMRNSSNGYYGGYIEVQECVS